MKLAILYAGGPCSCHPSRYVRFFIPPGVPGLEPVVSCRDAIETGPKSVHEHRPPTNAVFALRVPGAQ